MSEFLDADFIHQPLMNDNEWQESVVLFFHDEAAGISVYTRIGTQPPKSCCQEWIYVQGPEGDRFRRMRFGLPLTPRSRRPDGFAAGGLDWTYLPDGSIRLIADYPDLHLDILYRDFYPATPCWKWIGSDVLDIGAAHHYESSGSVEGVARIGSRNYRITRGLGHRDHSWGARIGGTMRACRWCAGTTGPEFSHSVLSFIDAKGHLALGGWVMRHGIVSHAKQIDIVALINLDGLTARGGRVAIVLEDGERIEIDIVQRSSFITGHDSDHGGPNSYVCSENVSHTRINCREGACCFTMCNDVTGMGEEVMMVLDRYATLTDGLSCRKARPSLLEKVY
jgi:hypothetical protein